MTHGIVTGFDGSARSEAAVGWAAAEATLRGVPLRIVHAWPWLGSARSDGPAAAPHQGALRELDEVTERLRGVHPGLDVVTEAVADDPVDALLARAAEHRLVVLGSRGLGGFAGLLVGSVGLAVAARSTTPVVLVRDGAPAVPADGADRPEVVAGVAGGSSAAVLEFAFAEAERRGGRVRAVHGWEAVPFWTAAGWVPPQEDVELRGAEIRDGLLKVLAPLRAAHPGVEAVVETRTGGAAPALVAASARADLVVVGRREHRLGTRLGAVAHAAVHHCTAPVAVVPHD
ncbi:stress-inducible protein [Kitasatospora phosalacinea]|uniref:Stress-inducible protein n=1 Tax=Kitasatospora phosalacinea TaxID=2065 RepID=A0A9W6QC69_9ACTN|nr:universal stress protein [Kitasatospora phosalacinea]GLW74122.1 stress-inducible protein [Kitasatospora phosalacinea]